MSYLFSSRQYCLVISFVVAFANSSPCLAGQPDTSANESWVTIGYNKDRIGAAWVQMKSYEELNENSFRLKAKYAGDDGRQIVGRLDVNCKNKDHYFRPNGVTAQNLAWATIPPGSGIESLGKLLCKRTAAKAEWGYTPETSYLWDAPPPDGDPANAKGEWVEGYNGDDAESFYNDRVLRSGDTVIYALYSRSKKGERSAAKPEDSTQYSWIRSSCKENLGSFYLQLDKAFPGEWGPPQPGRPGGANMAVKKKYC